MVESIGVLAHGQLSKAVQHLSMLCIRKQRIAYAPRIHVIVHKANSELPVTLERLSRGERGWIVQLGARRVGDHGGTKPNLCRHCG